MADRACQETLAALGAVDTPTICNALEIVAPERRNTGFTRLPVVDKSARVVGVL